jgi:superoxide dismutase
MKTQNKNERNLIKEDKFRHYLFKGDFKRHKEICKNLNVVESTPQTRGELNENYKAILANLVKAINLNSVSGCVYTEKEVLNVIPREHIKNELQTAEDILNETETEPFTIEERADLNINKVTHDKVKRANK